MSEPGAYSLPISFVGYDDAPIAFANAILVQNQQDEFILTLRRSLLQLRLGRRRRSSASCRAFRSCPPAGWDATASRVGASLS